MPNTLSSIQNELNQLIECYVEKKQISLANKYSSHTHVTEPHSQATYILEPKTLHSYLDVAIERRKPLLNSRTFYLQDLSDYQQTPYNSLIFEIDGHCFKSRDKPSQIINRFAGYNDKPYALLQALGLLVGITQKCPYIIRGLFFAPDRDTSKNEANWIGLHHVIHSESSNDYTYFSFVNNHELILVLNKKMVFNMVERAAILYRLEEILLYNAPKFEIATKIMGVSHLTSDEIKEYYPDWWKKK